MAVYNSTHTGDQIDTILERIVNLIYPIGSIYTSLNSTNPSALFGGTWQQIEGKFLLGCDSSHTSGSTGGEAEHILTTNETPAHTHSRGTMDIAGMVRCYSEYNKGNSSFDSNAVSGAFYFRTGTDTEYGTTTNMSSGSNDAIRNVRFQASRNWTGATSSVGEGAAHNNMPPYLAVYMWQRIA